MKMLEFFKGWRRKFGVLTLLMACVFAAGWVRSLIVADRINFFGAQMLSWHGEIMRCVAVLVRTQIGSQTVTSAQETPIWTIPYWSIVIPLTLLSAWLLLSNPKRSKSITAPAV
jgi:hypothetical protein